MSNEKPEVEAAAPVIVPSADWLVRREMQMRNTKIVREGSREREEIARKSESEVIGLPVAEKVREALGGFEQWDFEF